MQTSNPAVAASGFDRTCRGRSLTLRDSLHALLLAPAGAVTVVALQVWFFDDDNDVGFNLPTVALLGYSLAVCYLAELLFVVPGVVLRPSLRNPHPIGAVAYGILVAWSLPVARWLFDGGSWENMPLAAAAGAAAGALYAALTRK